MESVVLIFFVANFQHKHNISNTIKRYWIRYGILLLFECVCVCICISLEYLIWPVEFHRCRFLHRFGNINCRRDWNVVEASHHPSTIISCEWNHCYRYILIVRAHNGVVNGVTIQFPKVYSKQPKFSRFFSSS